MNTTSTPAPILDLMADHRRIEAVMNALERELAAGGAFPAEFIGRALTFFTEYADHFHHYKEEEHLFPALAAAGVPVDGGPIGVMLQDHAMGRSLLAAVRSSLDEAGRGNAAAQREVRGYALQYLELLRQHIWKEDNVLFRLAPRVLDDAAKQRLTECFTDFRGGNLSAEAVEEYKRFAAAASERS